MVPPRAKVFLSSLLALGLLAGSMPIFLNPGSSASALAPNAGKPSASAVEKAPLSPPKVQPNIPAPALSDRLVEYHMDVRYEPEENKLKGKQTLTWTHPGKKRKRAVLSSVSQCFCFQ